MHYSTALFALIASTFAAPLSKISPAPVVSAISSALPPRSTPVNNFKAAITGPVSSVTSLIGATKGSGVAAFKAVYQSINLNQVGSASGTNCLDSKNTEVQINTLLKNGGDNLSIFLCPSANIIVYNPIQFSHNNQTLTTLGSPTGSTRATITIGSLLGSAAIDGTGANADGCALRNLIFNGNRAILGQLWVRSSAIIEMGGGNSHQIMDSLRVYDPRGWSCIHVSEGAPSQPCLSSIVSNNVVGPSGNSTSGEWADGLSIACRKSVVVNNVITDATDAGISLFSPDLTITNNTIVANTQILLGAITMVDTSPYGGNLTNTIVSKNLIIANTSMIKIGIAVGSNTWGSSNGTKTFNGSVLDNTLSSGSSLAGYFGYGIAIAGANSTSVVGTKFVGASFGGWISSSNGCVGSMPSPQALIQDSQSSWPLQAGFQTGTMIEYLICVAQGNMTSSNYSSR